MQKIFMLTALSLTLVSCNWHDDNSQKADRADEAVDEDNTEKNIRDRDSRAKTPFDQSESEADRTITQKIRQAIVGDSSLSTNAKNIKIITIDGVVTLRGPVATPEERDNIIRKVSSVEGIRNVDNQLEVTKRS